MKLIALAIILSVGSLFAVDAVTNYYGLMKVNSSDSRTIVAIPWIDVSTTNGEIKVADVVMTADLADGDTIHYYNGTDFESWKLNSETQWVAAVQSDISGSSQNGTPAAEKALKRGNALILMRTNSDDRVLSPFYLIGQVAKTGVDTEISNANSLIAPPRVTQIDSNLGARWTNVGDNDRIYIETSTNSLVCKMFEENEQQIWKKNVVTGTVTKAGRTISYKAYVPVEANDLKVGTGYWFKKAGNSNVIAEWLDVPVVQE